MGELMDLTIQLDNHAIRVYNPGPHIIAIDWSGSDGDTRYANLEKRHQVLDLIDALYQALEESKLP
jgi:hypothetical protein